MTGTITRTTACSGNAKLVSLKTVKVNGTKFKKGGVFFSSLYKLNGADTKKIALKVKGAKAVWPTKSEVTLDTLRGSIGSICVLARLNLCSRSGADSKRGNSPGPIKDPGDIWRRQTSEWAPCTARVRYFVAYVRMI